MEVKIIDKWQDSDYGATNYLYDLGKGRKVIYTHKLGCNECGVRILLKGGALYEKQLGLPLGTAHFLEHMLCRPNLVLKTQEEIDLFCFGTKDFPAIYNFAYTTDQILCFGVDTHVLGYKRAIAFLSYIMNYPKELFNKNIEEERKVILAELGRYPSERKNEALEFNKFILEGKYKRYYKRTLGDKNNILDITTKDLEVLWDEIKKNKSVVISVQSGTKPSVKMINEFGILFDNVYDGNFKGNTRFYKIENKFKVGYYKDEKVQNIGLEIGVLRQKERMKRYNIKSYRKTILSVIAERVISFLLHKRLRDENHLVYEVNSFNSYITTDWIAHGIYTNFEKGLESEVLKNIWETLYGIDNAPSYELFLNSDIGKQWLEHEISKSIFVMNINFDKAYSENIGYIIACDTFPYKFDKDFVKNNVIKKITPQDVVTFINEELSSKQPYLWIKHNTSRSEIMQRMEIAIKQISINF